MRSRDDVDAYLTKSPYAASELDEGTWLVRDGRRDGDTGAAVVCVAEDLVTFRSDVLPLAAVDPGKRTACLEQLLRWNATDLLHCAYALLPEPESAQVILAGSMRLAELDYGELVAILDDLFLARANHQERLAAFCRA